jgi:hypothetical protein
MKHHPRAAFLNNSCVRSDVEVFQLRTGAFSSLGLLMHIVGFFSRQCWSDCEPQGRNEG